MSVQNKQEFLTALDALIKLADTSLRIILPTTCGSRQHQGEKKEPNVYLRKDTVIWVLHDDTPFEEHVDDLIKAESLVNEALEIAEYDKKTAMNHPNIYQAMLARIPQTAR